MGFDFSKYIDARAFRDKGLMDDYLYVGRKILIEWFGKLLKEMEGYKDFPYPIYLMFENEVPYCYDLATGEQKM